MSNWHFLYFLQQCKYENGGIEDFGENLAAHANTEIETHYSDADARIGVNGWIDEKKYYDCRSNKCAQGKECKHYTQVRNFDHFISLERFSRAHCRKFSNDMIWSKIRSCGQKPIISAAVSPLVPKILPGLTYPSGNFWSVSKCCRMMILTYMYWNLQVTLWVEILWELDRFPPFNVCEPLQRCRFTKKYKEISISHSFDFPHIKIFDLQRR